MDSKEQYTRSALNFLIEEMGVQTIYIYKYIVSAEQNYNWKLIYHLYQVKTLKLIPQNLTIHIKMFIKQLALPSDYHAFITSSADINKLLVCSNQLF